ncbi:alpha/beta hydrolase [Mycolicibacterium sp. 120270]|uniref:alpha/beta fold hydrolase n=1 Tax=Mycolicibacterium sp. 120270 TaxID=3090600 RepID=UPI00299E10AE|nr:alpha/beta hydrolase [Mycolicibacterium sp. 120270]MDX1882270.1 alpha/beta hydrolase [Mycolicibacterium sp. 120270]
MRTFLRVIVSLLAVLVLVMVVVNNTAARLPAMPQADGQYISLHGKEIHYFEQPGKGTAVVMIHGLPGTYKDFEPVFPELADRHVIAFDRPGFGWSKGGWLPYQDQIDVVHELLTSLKIAPAIIVGHSFGGTLALGVARKYPRDVAKMVLVAPGAGGIRPKAIDNVNARYAQVTNLPVLGAVLNVTVNNVIKRVAATAGAANAFAPEKIDPTFQQRLLAVTMTSGNLAAFASDQLELGDTARWVDENVPEIDVPSVIVGAEGDRLVGIDHVRELARTLPGARLVTVDGSHMIPYTHPDVIAAQVKS